MSSQARPFADSVADCAQAGWPCTLPVPVSKTRRHQASPATRAATPTPPQLVTWAGTHAGFSVALRMPDGVIGIDVEPAGVRWRR